MCIISYYVFNFGNSIASITLFPNLDLRGETVSSRWENYLSDIELEGFSECIFLERVYRPENY